jgi:hypothetical protein
MSASRAGLRQCDNAPQDFVNQIASIVRSFGLQPINGRNLGGTELEESVKRRIEVSDALVALFARRDQGDGWSTHPWVMGEFGHAVSTNLRTMALLRKASTGQSPCLVVAIHFVEPPAPEKLS